MTLEKRLLNLENLVNALSKRIDNLNFYTNADINGTRQSVSEITPYTETKTAYIDDTSITFNNIPNGNMTIFCPIDYTAERQGNTVLITFEPLTKVTDITIMIQ